MSYHKALSDILLITCFYTAILAGLFLESELSTQFLTLYLLLFLYNTYDYSARFIWKIFNGLRTRINWLSSVWFGYCDKCIVLNYIFSIYSIYIFFFFIILLLFLYLYYKFYFCFFVVVVAYWFFLFISL